MSKVRNNKSTWRLAEWLWRNIYQPNYEYEDWGITSQREKDMYYDKAVELLKKMQNFEFTGDDSHDD